MERRHPDEARRLYATSPQRQPTPPLHTNRQSTYRDIELQNELNEIKSRLRMTEDQLRHEREDFSMAQLKVIFFRTYHNTWGYW